MKSVLIAFLLIACQEAICQKDLRSLPHGKQQQQNLDLFLPAKISMSTPVIVMLHGGAWSMGGKEYTDKHARDLRDRGFVVANVDYRYVGPNVHAKDLLDDIEMAVRYLESQSKKYGFKAKGFHFAGISAGAHLAMLFAYTRNVGAKSVISLCGPTQFDTEENQKHIEKLQLQKVLEQLADSQYEKGNKPGKKFTDISPYAHIKNIPTLLFHGDRDDLVLFAQATFMAKKLDEAKVENKLIRMEGKGHDCGMNQPDSEKLVLDNISAWVKKHE